MSPSATPFPGTDLPRRVAKLGRFWSETPLRLRPASLLPLLVTFLLLGLAEVAVAQGFNLFSGRNHPELKWLAAETPHFRIMYPRHLSELAAQAAPIAEESFRALSGNLEVTFNRKIRIYLSDEDEITNGFALRLGNGHTNIWVHQNDLDSWTGPEKWLRHVIAHELAHIFHFRAVRSNAGLLQFLLAEPIPRFWAEGLAQYETETWNAQRGDRALRTAVLDDQLSYGDGRSIWNGRLMYAVGNSQVRYLASQYGDSSIAQILAHREPRLFGLLRVHDFGSAFRDVTGTSYRSFYDDWRRDVNVYYNTLAGQMEPLDSLNAPSLRTPFQYLYDLQYSPDTTHVAIVGVESVRRPVRRLVVAHRQRGGVRVVAEGAIQAPVAWSPDGTQLAFSRQSRGRYGSILNDLFLVNADGGRLRRLTHSRRATAPSFSPDGQRLAFAGSEAGTANVFILDLATGDERQVTGFQGDVQVSHVRWAPQGSMVAFAIFDAEGGRHVLTVDVTTGAIDSVATGLTDDRMPVWSPDGRRLAYTSLRDDVPNVFVYDVERGNHERVTFLALGASATNWIPPDSAHAQGRLAVISNASKTQDRGYLIDAGRRAPAETTHVPAPYAAWTNHRPPHAIPTRIEPDPDLIQGIRPYRSWHNITHVASLALPYYAGPDDWGIAGLTAWMEPLGKHVLTAVGGLSLADPTARSFFLGTYINNQLYPTIALTGYRFPGSARIYGNGLLVEEYSGGDVTARWPLNWLARPYTSTAVGARMRVAAYQPLNLDDLIDDLGPLPMPARGEQADVTIGFQRKRQRPYQHNVVHPLDGTGVRLMATAAAPVLGTDQRFIRGDLAAYAVLGDRFLPGLQRLFVYGRAQAQEGNPLPQDYLGFSRYDDVRVELAGVEQFLTGDAERVRGYRAYALGNRILFGSLEYRIPLWPNLQTQLLGVVGLGATTISGFADAGMVWSGADLEGADRRLGAGIEFKNALRLGNVVTIAHALGWGWSLLESDHREVYYRIRTALPF